MKYVNIFKSVDVHQYAVENVIQLRFNYFQLSLYLCQQTLLVFQYHPLVFADPTHIGDKSSFYWRLETAMNICLNRIKQKHMYEKLKT